jgi:quercetin dioxygenase-like cupin family protein
MAATFDATLGRAQIRPFLLAAIAGLVCAFLIGKALPVMIDTLSNVVEPLCAAADPPGSALDTVEPISSHALPNVPGKRVTIVRVFYGPGGFTRPHRHAGSVTAYVTKGEIRSQLGSGPVEVFKVGQSFFEPPGATHLVSAQCQQHRSRRTDRGVRGRRGRAADDVHRIGIAAGRRPCPCIVSSMATRGRRHESKA